MIDPGLPPHLVAAARAATAALRAAALGRRIELVTDPAGADLRVTAAPTLPEGAVALAREPLAVAVSPRLPVREVTAEQVRGMLSGAIANWSEAGSPIPLPVVPLPRHRPGTPVTDVEALVTELGAQPGGLALAPLSAIDFRVGTLSIDGIDLVRHPERAAAYPFQLHLFAASVAPASPPAVELVAAPGPLPLPPSDPAVTVTMVGDIILGRTVHTIMTRLGDFAAPFRLVADELRGADLTVGNLECSLSDTIEPPADPYTFAFMTRAAGVEGLLLAGIDGVSLANNHSMNFGGAGMRDTLAALDRAGIRHFGGGADLAAAQAPAIFDLRGLRVAYLGFDGITGDVYGASADSPGTAPLRVDGLVAGIEAARQHADIVIPFIHWGVEYTLTPTDEQRALARRAIEAGASLVVGSHPHWVQGMEIHQGRPIVYSLGNFVFDQEWSPETKQGLIMHLVFHGTRLVALRFVPVLIEHYYRPRIVSGQEMTAILDRVWASTDALASNPLR